MAVAWHHLSTKSQQTSTDRDTYRQAATTSHCFASPGLLKRSGPHLSQFWWDIALSLLCLQYEFHVQFPEHVLLSQAFMSAIQSYEEATLKESFYQ